MENAQKKCKLCAGKTSYLFSLEICNSIKGNYYECEMCRSLQSDHLDGISSSELQNFYKSTNSIQQDSGAAWRQYCVVSRLRSLLKLRIIRNLGYSFKVLDFGGGSGFVASWLKHKLGWDTYIYEPYGQPTFSSDSCFSSIDEVIEKGPYNLIIATEVFEHLIDPLETLVTIHNILDKNLFYIFVTTGLYIPGKKDKSWSYLAPQTGQHVIFYSSQSMRKVKEIVKASNLYQVGTEYEWLFIKDSSMDTNLIHLYNSIALNFLRLEVNLGFLPKIE